MKFSFKWLQDYIDIKDSVRDVADLLTFHAAEVEGVENDVIDIDILPNRGSDLSSYMGLARELRALYSFIKKSEFDVKEPKRADIGGARGNDNINISASGACQRYSMLRLSGVKQAATPGWMFERLTASGVGSISLPVDITNFVMLETGQPMHAFDATKVKDEKIDIRFASGGEKLSGLDDNSYELSEEDIVIANGATVLGLGGIKGGKGSEIDESTTEILLEAANFSPTYIQRTSNRLHLKTDASRRFSWGVDPHLTKYALERAAELFVDITGANVEWWEDDNQYKHEKVNIVFYPDRVVDVIGHEVDHGQMEHILTALGCEVVHKDRSWHVHPPTNRIDLVGHKDLVEEVARFIGYEAIEPQLPEIKVSPAKPGLEQTWERFVRELLVNQGYYNRAGYHFYSQDDHDSLKNKTKPVELHNPLSRRLTLMRTSLIPGLLRAYEADSRVSPTRRLFEIGTLFEWSDEGIPVESQSVGVLLQGDEDTSFYSLKGVVEYIGERLGLGDIDFTNKNVVMRDAGVWRAGYVASIVMGDKHIGLIGELDPGLVSQYDIGDRIWLVELSAGMLYDEASHEWEWSAPPKYPMSMRDISMYVPRTVTAGDFEELIKSGKLKYVVEVDLFDYDNGQYSPEGMKSFAYHITYQSDEKTLTDKEVDSVHSKIEDLARKNLNAEIR